ncbi:MAG: hypothetical protein R3B48_13050 [Kofleriaceae bacterium]
MQRFRVRDHFDGDILAGATLGERHLRLLLAHISPGALPPAVVVDLDGVVGATGSYFKAFLVRLLASRQNAPDPKRSDGLTASVYIANLHEDVATDLRGVLVDAGLACLEVLDCDDERVRRARCHGDLEPTVREALAALLVARAATAADLGRRDKKVGVTGWHYRLNVLLKLGLARRSKAERSWIYEPAAMEVSFG